MITLIEETKVVVNGSAAYVLDLQFDTAAELEKLPKTGKPFDSNNFPIGFDYGVPANGSIATCLGTSKTYVFNSTLGWQESGDTGETETKTATITANGTTEITPTAGKTMSKVTVTTNVPTPSDTTATAADIAEGKTAYCGGVKVTGTAVSIGHKVTFIVGNTTKYVYDVADGESITEPPTPSESGKAWFGWWTNSTMIGGTKISFPYTPTADITLYGILDTLAGMTWDINKGLTYSGGIGIFEVNYTYEMFNRTFEPDTFSVLGVGYYYNQTSTTPYELKTYSTTILICSLNSFAVASGSATGIVQVTGVLTSGDVYYASGLATNSANSREIAFTSGTDIANQTLVNWLTAYCSRTA